MDKNIVELRRMIVGSQIRISQMALSLHKEQERLEDITRVLDSLLINKEKENG